jgi:hypothetical protein
MKYKKINVFCALLATILSLSFLNMKNKDNSCVVFDKQQVGVAASVAAYYSEGGEQAAYIATAGMCYGFAVKVGIGAATNGWNPGGWVGGVVAGVAAL